MKKKVIIAIIAGFVSLIIGLILAGIGFFSGGVSRLAEVAAPKEIHQTYTELNTIRVDLLPHSISIKESEDEQYHVTYANSENGNFTPIQLTEKDGVLHLLVQKQEFAIEGIMQLLGETLSYGRVDVSTVTIEIPKGKTLQKLEGHDLETYGRGTFMIENTHIKEIDVYGGVHLVNSQIDSGQVKSSHFQATNSSLKNIEISSYGGYNFLSKTSLENVTMTDYSQLESKQLTLLGKNIFSPSEAYLSSTRLDLTDKSLADSSLYISSQLDKKRLAENSGYYYDNPADLETMFGEGSYLKDQLDQIGIYPTGSYDKLPVKKDGDSYNLTVENKDSKNSLTIEGLNARIVLGPTQ